MNRRPPSPQSSLDLGRAAYERVQATKKHRKRDSERSSDQRPVLITGIGNYWGGRVALALEEESKITELLGMDVAGPATSFSRLEYIHMSLRSPFLADMLRHRRVDTVVHMEWRDYDRSGGREKMLETNVLGTRHLLSACKEAGVRKVIVRSSTQVYGPNPDNPNFIPERFPARARARDPHLRDQVECEQDFREFLGHKHERPILTILRFAHIVGASAPSAMNRFLRRRKLPAVLGYDPLLQFIHEDDMVAAVVAATLADVRGAVNVAADGVLPLTRVAAILGKKLDNQVLPLVPPVEQLASFLPRAQKPVLPSAYLRFLCNGDTKRMKTELGFQPRFTGQQILKKLGRVAEEDVHGLGRTAPAYEDYVQRCLDEVLEKDDARG
jgi:UDP-glucose 4-epimerase